MALDQRYPVHYLIIEYRAPRIIALALAVWESPTWRHKSAGGGDGTAEFLRCGQAARGAVQAKGDPLEAIGALVPWESFRVEIEAVVLTPEADKKSNAGRKPIDALVLLRMLVLQSLYNLSDEQVEYQVRDRLSFTRFLELGIEDRIPDGTTLWLFREKLVESRIDREAVRSDSAGTWRPRAISRAAARWSTRRSCRCPGSATRARRTRR